MSSIMSSSFNSMYTHNNNSSLGHLPTSPIYTRHTNPYSPSINNNPSHTTSTSPYYHHIQAPPLAVLDQPHQTMSQKGSIPTSTQWPDSRLNTTMFNPVSSFTPYQSNGSIHSIVAMDEKIQKPIYPQHSMSAHQPVTLPPPQNHPGVDMSNAATMGVSRAPTRQLTNSKRAAQNRAAQRAFRQRKDKYIKDLEAKAKELETTKKQLEALQKEKAEMAVIIRNLKNENAKLKGEEVVDDDGRHGGNNSSAGTNSNYSHYNSSRNEEDSQGLGEEPWLRHRESARKEALNRPGSGLTDNPPRGSGIVLPPGPNTDSTVDPLFRPDYRHTNSNSPSPSSSASSDRNRNSYGGTQSSNNNNGRTTGYSSNDEDTDRVYDDLCELLKTRSRPALPQNLGRRVS